MGTTLLRCAACALALGGVFAACAGAGGCAASSARNAAADGGSAAPGDPDVSAVGCGADARAGDAGATAQPVYLGWTDETAARGLAGISTRCRNVAFGDLDGDAAPDLVVPSSSGITLLRNDGHGHFAPWAVLPVGQVTSGLQQCAIALADLDADGKLDIAVGIDEPDRPVGVYFNDGGGAFTAVFAQLSPPQSKLQSYAIGVANGTGSSPVVFACEQLQGSVGALDKCQYDAMGINLECPETIAVPSSLAWNVSGRTLVPSSDPALAIVGQTQGLGISDFDGDGRDDVLVATDFAKQNALRGGASAFSNVTAAWGMDVFGHGMGWALGDIDEDGRVDAVASTLGGFIEWKGLGDAGFALRGANSMYETRRRDIWPWTVLFEDLDNNGFMDLVAVNEFASAKPFEPTRWIQSIGGPADFVGVFDTVIFKNGASSFQESRLPYDAVLPHHGRGQCAALADVDGDGRVEMVLPIMRDDGSQMVDVVVGKIAGVDVGHGLSVRFSGRAVPPGTTVELSCGGRAQSRRIYAAEGAGGAARREAHFGCGDATSFDALHVEVPGSAPIDVPGGPLDRAITIALP